MFFFEKKTKKTFARWHTRPSSTWATAAKEKKFFASFFQKRSASCFCPCRFVAHAPARC
jgi:hypothetical protein